MAKYRPRKYSRDQLEALREQYPHPSEQREPAPPTAPPAHFEKYSSSVSGQTGEPQTDLYFGDEGQKGGHIAVNAAGDTEHVRDSDGEVLYDKLDPDNPYN